MGIDTKEIFINEARQHEPSLEWKPSEIVTSSVVGRLLHEGDSLLEYHIGLAGAWDRYIYLRETHPFDDVFERRDMDFDADDEDVRRQYRQKIEDMLEEAREELEKRFQQRFERAQQILATKEPVKTFLTGH